MKSGSSAPTATGAQCVGDALRRLVQPDVAAGVPGHLAAGAADDELAHAVEAGERLVGVGLERGAAAAARRLVGGDRRAWRRESSMRERSASAEKPAKTTEWTAPMRAQASMA